MQDENQFLVVGGTSGIGLELVRKLSDQAAISVCSRDTTNILPAGVDHHYWDASTEGDTPPVPEKLAGMA